jgi:VCBS repeat-containing protein
LSAEAEANLSLLRLRSEVAIELRDPDEFNVVPYPTVSTQDANGSEADGAVHFTLTLSEAPTFPVQVTYSLVAGTATADSDYKSSTGIIVFDAGETTKEVVIDLLRDHLPEGDETFSLKLLNPYGVALEGGGTVATYTGIIKDSAGNSNPTAVNDTFSTAENTPVAGSVLANDTDPESDPLQVVSINGGASGVGSEISLGSGAKVTVRSDGTFTYNQGTAFDFLNPGETATDTFTYGIDDGAGGQAMGTVTIEVHGQYETKNGTNRANKLKGSDFADWIRGFDGPDVISSGGGNDRVEGGSGRDVVKAGAGNDIIRGDSGNDRLYGGNGDDSLGGGKGDDILRGQNGDDWLSGRAGFDKLLGGKGEDKFVFETAPHRSSKDVIQDFKVADDTIYLAKAAFKRLGHETGDLDASMFRVNHTGRAKDKDDHIIYDKDSGILYYDADGSGKGAAVAFATISEKLKLTNDDFYVF